MVGAELPPATILILGFASLFADGVSMAASDVLAERSRPERPVSLRKAARHGVATFLGFVAAGFTPLLAYLAPGLASAFPGGRFALATALAGATLFLVGAARARFTGGRGLAAGLEMLAIGAAAGAVAYGVGATLGALIEV